MIFEIPGDGAMSLEGGNIARARRMTIPLPAALGSARVSVVINTNGRYRSLRETLAALRLQTHRRYELCVVCGPKDDGTRELVAELAARGELKAAYCEAPNLSVSRNIGIGQAAGDFVAFIDDDAIPEPIWLEQLLTGFDDERVAGVSGMVFQPNGRDLQFRFSTCDRFGLARHDLSGPADETAFPFSPKFPHVMGTNAIFRREALVAIGGFDEEYEYYLDEADLCCRLVDDGYLIRQHAFAPVHHRFLSGAVRDAEGITSHYYPILKNQLYFSLANGRGHASLPEMLEVARDFVARHRADVAFHVERGAFHAQALAAFDTDHDRAWEVALSRGLAGGRRLAGPERFAAPPSFCELDGEARRHVVIVAEEGASLDQARARAQRRAEEGAFVRLLLLAAPRPMLREGVELDGGVWQHFVAAKSGSGEAGRALAGGLERISAYHAIDEVEDPEGLLIPAAPATQR